jgi:hypothetical protein
MKDIPWSRFWEYTKKSAQNATLEFFRPLIRSALMQVSSEAASAKENVAHSESIAAEIRKTPRLERDQDPQQRSGAILQPAQKAVRPRRAGFHSQALSILEALPSKIGDEDRENSDDPRWLIEALDEVNRDYSPMSDSPARAVTAAAGLRGEERKVEPARAREEFVKRGKQSVEVLHSESEIPEKSDFGPEELNNLIRSVGVQVEERRPQPEEAPDERDSDGGQWDELFKSRKPPVEDRVSVVSEVKIQRA